MSTQGNTSVAMIGGGIAGLTAARVLTEAGFSVRVFDKGRGAGGRASTRRAGERRFDHGAQYFTVKDDRFAAQVETWIGEGHVEEWTGLIADVTAGEAREKERTTQRFVGVPGMNAIVKQLAASAHVEFGVRVERLERRADGWALVDDNDNEISNFGHVALTLPPEQTLALLESADSSLVKTVRTIRSDPCWAVLASFDERLPIDFDGAFVHESSLGWIARDSSKPQRSAGERWVLHASSEWSLEHLEEKPEPVGRQLLSDFFDATGAPPCEPEFLTAHRWRFAKVEEPRSDGFLWDPESTLGVCGDWCHRSRVEGAFLSGLELAERMVADLRRDGVLTDV